MGSVYHNFRLQTPPFLKKLFKKIFLV